MIEKSRIDRPGLGVAATITGLKRRHAFPQNAILFNRTQVLINYQPVSNAATASMLTQARDMAPIVRVKATFCLLVVADAVGDCLAKCFANAFDGDAVEDLLEEAGHDRANRFDSSEAAGLSVKDQFVVDSAARATVSTAYVVSFDLQSGNRIGAGCCREQQVVVSLVAVCFLSSFVDLDHSSPNRTRCVLQSCLVKEVADAMCGAVVLQCVVGEMLLVFCEQYAVDLGAGSRSDQLDMLIDFGES